MLHAGAILFGMVCGYVAAAAATKSVGALPNAAFLTGTALVLVHTAHELAAGAAGLLLGAAGWVIVLGALANVAERRP